MGEAPLIVGWRILDQLFQTRVSDAAVIRPADKISYTRCYDRYTHKGPIPISPGGILVIFPEFGGICMQISYDELKNRFIN